MCRLPACWAFWMRQLLFPVCGMILVCVHVPYLSAWPLRPYFHFLPAVLICVVICDVMCRFSAKCMSVKWKEYRDQTPPWLLVWFLHEWSRSGLLRRSTDFEFARFWSWLMLLSGSNAKDGVKHLASLQILCAALWLRSGNVRAWPAALPPLLAAPQPSLDPPPNQVTSFVRLLSGGTVFSFAWWELVKRFCFGAGLLFWLYWIVILNFYPQIIPVSEYFPNFTQPNRMLPITKHWLINMD